MAVDETLAAAFIDGGHGKYAPNRLLGVRVRRFCLWHRLILNTLDSPFMNNGRVTFYDLRTAVGVCRLEFGDCHIRRPWLVPFLLHCWIFFASMFRRSEQDRTVLQGTLLGEVRKFLSYCGDYLQEPAFTVIPPKNASGHHRGRAPDEFEQVAELVNWSKWSEEEIWNMPIGRANWYRVMARRDAGLDVDFMTKDEQEFLDQLPPEFRFHR